MAFQTKFIATILIVEPDGMTKEVLDRLVGVRMGLVTGVDLEETRRVEGEIEGQDLRIK